MSPPPAIAFHPLVSPSLPKEKITFLTYRYMVSYPNWNLALSWIRRAKAWDNGIEGARFLIELTERFEKRLSPHQCVRNQVQVYLFLLDTLRRAEQVKEYMELWNTLRVRKDLTLCYRPGSPAARSEYIVSVRPGFVEVNLLWLCKNFVIVRT